MKKWFLYIFGFGVIAGALVLYAMAQKHKSTIDGDAARRSGKPIPVSIAKVERGTLAVTAPAECSLAANPVVEISTALKDAPVAEVFVEEGAFVEKGAVLLQLDDELEAAELKEGEARVRWLAQEVEARKALLDFFKANRAEGFSPVPGHDELRQLSLARLGAGRERGGTLHARGAGRRDQFF